MIVYYCHRCATDRPAMHDANGKEKIRRFPTGFVARWLACGHTIKVTDQGRIAA